MTAKRMYFIHALSPLHAGTGQGIGLVDLPIAREKATKLPIVPGSTVKGVLRAESSLADDQKTAVFGPETGNASDYAGAIVFGDARLLCLPVRSLYGTFAWVTSPMVLERYRRDAMGTPAQFEFDFADADVFTKSPANGGVVAAGSVYLEDLKLKVAVNPPNGTSPGNETADLWATHFSSLLWPIQATPNSAAATWRALFKARFVIVSDDDFAFLYETATEICARIRIAEDTKTVANGQLWYEEALPAESLLWGVAMGEKSRKSDVNLTDAQVLDHAVGAAGADRTTQFGGKATVGRGVARFIAGA
ncbi:MAG: type III-B CRISPR module RAMP protein Cmr4 [Deltaproteobacteria bacterium]|nr:type III-B CRISPR module RAMP protein Cmr4 [Deltaproteobacteria bacterium]